MKPWGHKFYCQPKGALSCCVLDTNSNPLDPFLMPLDSLWQQPAGPVLEFAGSAMALTMQLAQLLSQLNAFNSFVQQQQQPNRSGFVLSQINPLNSLNLLQNYHLKFSNLCHSASSVIIDSSAMNHMTWDQIKLQNFTQIKDPHHMIVANGNKAKIRGFGTTKLFCKKHKNILCLSKFNSNLLSINKITWDLNCNVIFSPNKVIFQDQVTQKTIGEGKLENGLYYLEDTTKICVLCHRVQ